jgi:hypothetical protein
MKESSCATFSALQLSVACNVRHGAGATLLLASGGPSFPTGDEGSFPIPSIGPLFLTHQRGFRRRAN